MATLTAVLVTIYSRKPHVNHNRGRFKDNSESFRDSQPIVGRIEERCRSN